eukprot:3066522-Amphidinium_carterae.1
MESLLDLGLVMECSGLKAGPAFHLCSAGMLGLHVILHATILILSTVTSTSSVVAAEMFAEWSKTSQVDCLGTQLSRNLKGANDVCEFVNTGMEQQSAV